MSHHHVTAVAGWSWLGAGWRRFRRAPAHWLLITGLLGALSAGLTLIPQSGPFLVALVGPTLFGSLLASAGETGGRPTLYRAVVAMRQVRTTGRLLTLGLIPLLGSAILWGAADPLLGIPFGTELVFGASELVIRVRPLGAFLFLALTVTVMLAVWACLLFAIPQVIHARATIGQALRTSLSAVHDNLGAFLVFFVTQAVLALLAVMAFGLGLLVLVPVLAGAVMAAHDCLFASSMTDASPRRGSGRCED